MSIKEFVKEYVRNNYSDNLNDCLEYNSDTQGECRTRFLYVRYFAANENTKEIGSIDFGWIPGFNKWSDSTNWFIASLPQSYNEFVDLINYCEYLGAISQKSDDFVQSKQISLREVREFAKKQIKVISIKK